MHVKKVSLFLILTLMIIGFASITTTLNIYGNSKLVENISDFKVYLRNIMIDEENVEITNNDTFEINNINGNITYEIVNDSTEYDAEVYLECNRTKEEEKEWNFDYTGSEQIFNVPTSGIYKLETWGASGGSVDSYSGGYGAYSVGEIKLENKENLYINVGGVGLTGLYSSNGISTLGGYNGGGGNTSGGYGRGSSGGGATHIAGVHGLLSSLKENLDSVFIVSGGGGGGGKEDAYIGYCYGGHAGGISGSSGTNNPNRGTGGSKPGEISTQTSGYSIGLGENSVSWTGGGGGGFYGGYSGCGSAGGSSYIGNSLLTEKSMYCYNCTESDDENTKTISTTCASETPTENCSKIGNGYARITLLESNELLSTEKTIIEAQEFFSSNIEINDYKSLTCNLKVSKISRTSKKDINIK